MSNSFFLSKKLPLVYESQTFWWYLKSMAYHLHGGRPFNDCFTKAPCQVFPGPLLKPL